MTESDYATWLTKQQAAETLGISTKSVERLARARRLEQARWRRPSGGPELVVYHPGDVARVAEERRPGAAPVILPAGAERTAENLDMDRRAVAPAIAPGDDILRAAFAALVQAALSHMSGMSETGGQRLFLTLREAAALTGLSQAHLRRRCIDGSLPAVRDRGGWRIRRRDLEVL